MCSLYVAASRAFIEARNIFQRFTRHEPLTLFAMRSFLLRYSSQYRLPQAR